MHIEFQHLVVVVLHLYYLKKWPREPLVATPVSRTSVVLVSIFFYSFSFNYYRRHIVCVGSDLCILLMI